MFTSTLSSNQECVLYFAGLGLFCLFGVFQDKVSSCSYLMHVGSWCRAILASTDGIPVRLNRWCTLGALHVFYPLIGFETRKPGSSSSEVTPPKTCVVQISGPLYQLLPSYLCYLLQNVLKGSLKQQRSKQFFAVKTILCVFHLW